VSTAVGDPIDVSGDPSIARYDHGGQPGTTWDMFGVKASESLTTSAGSLGARTGIQASGLATGKDGKNGPTPDMLRQYYSVLMILTGDLNSGIFGKFINRGANDVVLLQDYLTVPAPGTSTTTKRAIIIEGDGFLQSEIATGEAGPFPEHKVLCTDYLGIDIKRDGSGVHEYSYQPWSGNFNQYVDVNTFPPYSGVQYTVGNACLWGNDVATVVVNSLNAVKESEFQNFGTHGPYIAGVYTPLQAGKIYESFVDCWDIEHLFAHVAPGGANASPINRVSAANDVVSGGRTRWMWDTFKQIQAATGAQIQGVPFIALDVPPGQDGRHFVDFMQVRNNPLITGKAVVYFGLSRPDRVTARVFDVSGRLVRTLTDRFYAEPGEYPLFWDGTDDGGRQMERGVYFTQVKFARNRFSEARKLTVLK